MKNLRVKYHLLKELTNLLDILEFLILGGGFYFLGAHQLENSLILFLILSVMRWADLELNYYVNRLLIRLELRRK